jgi:transcriptional regulator with XRE-family HTH domain
VARPRRTPQTAFGAWLDQWLTEHPETTFKALGAEIAEAMGREKPITAGAISQWINGETRRIPIDTLRGIAAVTEEPVENLERMVYGRHGAVAASVSVDVLDALEERMRRAFREELEAALAQLRADAGPRSSGA